MKIEKYKDRYGNTRYRFRASAGYDNNGKQIRVRRSGFRTRKEAELAYIEVSSMSHVEAAKEPRTVDEIFKAWFSIKRLEIKESTAKKLFRLYKSNFEESIGHRNIGSFSVSELQQVALNLADRYQSPARPFGLLRSLFLHAYRQDIIAEDLTDKVIVPKKRKSPPRKNYYTKEELKLFLKLAEEQLSHQWYVFFLLLASTGLRRGEALGLMWDDITSDTLTVRRTVSNGSQGHAISDTPKTSASYRTIYIDSSLYDNLMSLKDGNSPFVFSNSKGSFITPSQPGKKLKTVKGIAQITAHGFRHTHCSLLFSAGVSIPEVQERLGHSDLATTMRIYNHVYKEDKKKAFKKYQEFMGL